VHCCPTTREENEESFLGSKRLPNLLGEQDIKKLAKYFRKRINGRCGITYFLGVQRSCTVRLGVEGSLSRIGVGIDDNNNILAARDRISQTV